MSGAPATALVLAVHGTVDSLDDLPEFLANIRRGHPAPPELLAEVRRRYEAIGGRSPLTDITRALAGKLEARLGIPVRMAMRLFRPSAKDVLGELTALGVRRVVVVALAQFSSHVYGEAVKEAARAVGGIDEVVVAPDWGSHPRLVAAFAGAIAAQVRTLPDGARAALLLTAHSLPKAVVDAGDPYEREVRASASAIVAALPPDVTARIAEHAVVFQSQGMGTGPGGRPMVWLGPDLKTALEDVARTGAARHVVVAPIGFLADHVEILYDLDIEARGWAEELGVVMTRTASLNATDNLVETVVDVAGPLVERA